MADARFEISFVTCTTDSVISSDTVKICPKNFWYTSTFIQLSHQLYPSTTKYHRECVSVLYTEEFKGHDIDRNDQDPSILQFENNWNESDTIQ